MCCFVLYLLDVCQIDGNKLHERISQLNKILIFIIKVTEQQSTTFVVTSLFLCLRATWHYNRS